MVDRLEARREPQTTNTVVMVRPDHFAFNSQTSVDNEYQNLPVGLSPTEVKNLALQEFHGMKRRLIGSGIDVIELPSPKSSTPIPDAVFPNNWLSTHSDGTIVLYPMATENRRLERQIDVLHDELRRRGINYPTQLDLTKHEVDGRSLEGTGSLVLDRANRIAYAIKSERTDPSLFHHWADMMGYEGVLFQAKDQQNPPYHTNVIMAVGENVAVVASDIIAEQDRDRVIGALQDTNHDVIKITLNQVTQMCGNILAVDSAGDSKIVLSRRAYDGFSKEQRGQLQEHGEFIIVNIPTIERIGGGSARCMIAEIFVPQPIAVFQSPSVGSPSASLR